MLIVFQARYDTRHMRLDSGFSKRKQVGLGWLKNQLPQKKLINSVGWVISCQVCGEATMQFELIAPFKISPGQEKAVEPVSGQLRHEKQADASGLNGHRQNLRHGKRHQPPAKTNPHHFPQQDFGGSALRRTESAFSPTTALNTSSASTIFTSLNPTCQRRTCTLKKTPT